MDGSELVRTLAGDEHLDEAKDAHSRYYGRLLDLLAPLDGARELLDAIADRGLQVVLASSAPQDELEALRRTLKRDEIVSVTTDSDDVGTAKPAPDIVRVALERSGVDPGSAVFVGDSVWDVRAAARADVTCIGLRSGGTSLDELTGEGAVTVWDDPRDLLDHLDESPIGRLGR